MKAQGRGAGRHPGTRTCTFFLLFTRRKTKNKKTKEKRSSKEQRAVMTPGIEAQHGFFIAR